MSYGQSMLDFTQAFCLCLFYAISCLSFGTSILRILRISPVQGMYMSCAGYLGGAFFIGQGVIGGVFQTIAALSQFSFRIVFVLLIVASLSGFLNLLSIYKKVLNSFLRVIKDTILLGPFGIIVGLLSIVLIVLFALLSFHPPGTDAISYYLAQAKLIGATGQLYPLPAYEFFSKLGLNAEMHAASLFLMGGDVAGEYASKMLVWITALASGMMLWAIGSRVGLNRRAQWLIIVMLYTTTGFTNVLWDGKTDLFSTGLGLAAIYWILQIGRLTDRIVFFLSGLMVGFAINSKMSLIVVMMPMLSIFSVWSVWVDSPQKLLINGNENKQKVIRILYGSLIGFVGMIIPFLMLSFKNIILFKEPFAPFFMIGSNDASVVLDQVWFSPEITKWIILTYPLALFFGRYPMQYGNISPLLLAFIPISLMIPKVISPFKNKRLLFLVFSAFIGVLAWVILRPSVIAPRYILPPLLIFLLLGAYFVECLWERKTNILLKISVALITLFMIFATIIDYQNPLRVAKNYWIASSRTYASPIWKALNIVNDNTSLGASVYLAMYYRSPLRGDLLQCLIRTQKALDKDIWEAIYKDGGTWMVLDRLTHAKSKDIVINPEIKPSYLSVITHPIDDRFTVYQIVPKEGAPAPIQQCFKQKDGTWGIQKLY